MLNLYEAVRPNPGINKLEIGDFLFAEFATSEGLLQAERAAASESAFPNGRLRE